MVRSLRQGLLYQKKPCKVKIIFSFTRADFDNKTRYCINSSKGDDIILTRTVPSGKVCGTLPETADFMLKTKK